MKIAIIGSFTYAIPILKGGIHAPLALTQNLAAKLSEYGHEVTFFGLIDKSVPDFQPNYKVNDLGCEPIPAELLKKGENEGYRQRLKIIFEQAYTSRVIKEYPDFDLYYSWGAYFTAPFAKFTDKPVVVTHHDSTNTPKYNCIFSASFSDNLHLIPISYDMKTRLHFPEQNYMDVVYNGINTSDLPEVRNDEGFFSWVGRVIPSKGLHTAIGIAKQKNVRLKIAGPMNKTAADAGDVEEYVDEIRREIEARPDLFEYLGVLDHEQVLDLLSKSKGLIFPSDGVEGCPMVPIEAMVCGTPVITSALGPLPEIVENNITGFTCNSEEEMAEAIMGIDSIDRQDCANIARARFSLDVMAENYQRVFEGVINR